MKTRLITLFFGMLAFASCSDDVAEFQNKPAQTGEEVLFGTPVLRTQSENSSRTIYGDKDEINRAFPINWVNGDTIAIYCPEASAPQTKLVHYVIGMDANDVDTIADRINKLNPNEAGLQWGSSEMHRFYGFYPGQKVSSEHLVNGALRAEIPTLQKPISFWRRPSDGSLIAQPDMSNAFMYAYSSKTKSDGQIVQLQFKPLVTALVITVNGPADGDSIAISKIVVSSRSIGSGTQPVPITGKFDMTVDSEGNISCKSVPSGVVNNLITIPCYQEDPDTKEKRFVKLAPGQVFKAVAFIVPDDEMTINASDIQVSVTPLNKTPLTKTLTGQAMKVRLANTVSLPKLKRPEGNEWMKSLDDNIFLTELSLPGSKLSYSTEANGAPIVYQVSTLQEQYNAGVRAFIFQTGAVNDPGGNHYLSVAVDAPGNQVKRFKPLREVMEELTALTRGSQEYVFALITYSGGATDESEFSSSEEFWIKTLEKELQSYKANPALAVYTEPVQANTTLGDLRGKILLKANYNSETMGNYVSDTQLPCMFTLWERGYEPGGVSMPWGSPKNMAGLFWLYQEQTNVYDFAEKERNINTVFDLAVTKYNDPSYGHDTWFMNDLGGYDATPNGTTASPAKKTTLEVATHFNMLAVNKLQARTQNAALGLLYMNFAGMQPDYGQVCKSDWLIQTTIDNNFKFPLRVKEGTSYSGRNSRAVTDGWDQ